MPGWDECANRAVLGVRSRDGAREPALNDTVRVGTQPSLDTPRAPRAVGELDSLHHEDTRAGALRTREDAGRGG
eukprot:1083294-Prymnesium_polylepis.1